MMDFFVSVRSGPYSGKPIFVVTFDADDIPVSVFSSAYDLVSYIEDVVKEV